MNIILDTLIFGMQKNGGVAVYWNEMFKRFLKDDNNTLYILGLEKGYINIEFLQQSISGFDGNPEKGNNLQIIRNSEPQIKKKISKPTIFQSTYLRVSHKKNIINVVTVHDFIYQLFPESVFNNANKLKVLLNDYQKRKAFRAVAGIVCISENTKRDLLKIYPFVSKTKIRVIHNAASEDYYPLRNKSFPRKFSVLNGKKYILYVGGRSGYKNFDFIIKVIKKMNNLSCVFIGDDLNQEEILKIGKKINCFYHYKDVPNSELNILYNNAYCFIFPSLYEGFGIPILEAMKTKCPVIAFNNSSIPEVMRGTGIMLENNDLDGCIEALNKLDDSKFRQALVEKEYDESNYFSWDKTYLEYIEFYQTILKGKQYG